jgi:hypothetical protein
MNILKKLGWALVNLVFRQSSVVRWARGTPLFLEDELLAILNLLIVSLILFLMVAAMSIVVLLILGL